MPSNLPTQNPSTIITPNPTQIGVVGITSVNSKGSSSSENQITSSSIIAIIACIIVVLIMIGICIYVTTRKTNSKLTPYEEWTAYYSNRNKNTIDDVNQNTDIHHFYNKQNRLSINPSPSFTPHVSVNSPITRNSNIGVRRNSQIHYAI
jgi:hypothetical protein